MGSRLGAGSVRMWAIPVGTRNKRYFPFENIYSQTKHKDMIGNIPGVRSVETDGIFKANNISGEPKLSGSRVCGNSIRFNKPIK